MARKSTTKAATATVDATYESPLPAYPFVEVESTSSSDPVDVTDAAERGICPPTAPSEVLEALGIPEDADLASLCASWYIYEQLYHETRDYTVGWGCHPSKDGSWFATAVERHFGSLTQRLADMFVRYITAACGGEARYFLRFIVFARLTLPDDTLFVPTVDAGLPWWGPAVRDLFDAVSRNMFGVSVETLWSISLATDLDTFAETLDLGDCLQHYCTECGELESSCYCDDPTYETVFESEAFPSVDRAAVWMLWSQLAAHYGLAESMRSLACLLGLPAWSRLTAVAADALNDGGVVPLLDPVTFDVDYERWHRPSDTAFGGDLWAAAARLVADYVDGNINRRTFVDQSWSLQHNSGSLLNKIWAFTQPLTHVLKRQACSDTRELLRLATWRQAGVSMMPGSVEDMARRYGVYDGPLWTDDDTIAEHAFHLDKWRVSSGACAVDGGVALEPARALLLALWHETGMRAGCLFCTLEELHARATGWWRVAGRLFEYWSDVTGGADLDGRWDNVTESVVDELERTLREYRETPPSLAFGSPPVDLRLNCYYERRPAPCLWFAAHFANPLSCQITSRYWNRRDYLLAPLFPQTLESLRGAVPSDFYETLVATSILIPEDEAAERPALRGPEVAPWGAMMIDSELADRHVTRHNVDFVVHAPSRCYVCRVFCRDLHVTDASRTLAVLEALKVPSSVAEAVVRAKTTLDARLEVE